MKSKICMYVPGESIYVVTERCRYEAAELHVFCAGQLVCELMNFIAFAPEQNHLNAVIVIQMSMHGRYNAMMMVVLLSGKRSA